MTSMMIGDHSRSNLIGHWDYHCLEDSANHMRSPIALANRPDASHYEKAVAVLQRNLPWNKGDVVPPEDRDSDDFDLPADAFSCDNFRMFEFKVKECVLARSHDWTACPFAHPGEKARRRDPRKYRYAGSACPDFRKGACRRGDACEYAHGVFECWLHPARYRTQQCKDGTHCRRRVCFFAHTPEQLRVSPNTGSPDVPSSGLGQDSFLAKGLFGFSPKSTSYPPPPSSPATGSPPVSPSGSVGLNSVKQLSESMRHLQPNKMKIDLSLSPSPPFWGLGIRSGSTSLPSTPIPAHAPPWLSSFDAWGTPREEEPAMERVESGRELRERIYAKLGEENSLDRVGRVDPDSGASPDLGWVAK